MISCAVCLYKYTYMLCVYCKFLFLSWVLTKAYLIRREQSLVNSPGEFTRTCTYTSTHTHLSFLFIPPESCDEGTLTFSFSCRSAIIVLTSCLIASPHTPYRAQKCTEGIIYVHEKKCDMWSWTANQIAGKPVVWLSMYSKTTQCFITILVLYDSMAFEKEL